MYQNCPVKMARLQDFATITGAYAIFEGCTHNCEECTTYTIGSEQICIVRIRTDRTMTEHIHQNSMLMHVLRFRKGSDLNDIIHTLR